MHNNNYKGLIPSGPRKPVQEQLQMDEIFKPSREVMLTAAPSNRNKKFIGLASIAIALVLFAVVAFVSYRYTVKPVDFSEIKLVRRELGPIKTLPAEPGGEKFSNQDKMIYEAIEKGGRQPELAKKSDELRRIEQEEASKVAAKAASKVASQATAVTKSIDEPKIAHKEPAQIAVKTPANPKVETKVATLPVKDASKKEKKAKQVVKKSDKTGLKTPNEKKLAQKAGPAKDAKPKKSVVAKQGSSVFDLVE